METISQCISSFIYSNNNITITEIISVARDLMGNDPAHGWPHVERVLKIADTLARGYCNGINREVVALAIILHDIGRFNNEKRIQHALASVDMASMILKEHGYQDNTISMVSHAILAHSWSLGVKAKTLEAMILSDADKLDALGAVGIARVFHTGCQMNRGFNDSIGHFYEKILRIPERLYLPEAKWIAKERLRIIENFLEAWRRESIG